MTNTYLYKNFIKDKRTYNLNQGYWKKKFQSKLEIKFSDENILFNNIDKNGNKIYDANPIFTYVNNNQKKAIRIIQDEITNDDVFNPNIRAYLISAWTDNIMKYNNFNDSKYEIKELVIALFLTKETIDISIKLMGKWLNNDLNQNEIDNIIDYEFDLAEKRQITASKILKNIPLNKYINKNNSYIALFINLDKKKITSFKNTYLSLKDKGYTGSWNISKKRKFNKIILYIREDGINKIYIANYKKIENDDYQKTLYFKNLKYIENTEFNWVQFSHTWNPIRYIN